MYATPVAYPLSAVQGTRLAPFIQYNPLTPLIEGFRYAIFGKGDFNIGMLLFSVASAVVILIIGLLLFHKVEKTFMDTV